MHKISRFLYIAILTIAFFVPKSYIFAENTTAYDARFDIRYQNNMLYFDIKLDKGYRIYGPEDNFKNSPKDHDSGFPIKIDLSQSENIKNFRVIWPATEKEYFHGRMYHYIYSGDVSIPVEIEPENDSLPVKIQGTISYAICNDSCVPVSQSVFLDLGVIPDSTSHTIYWALIAGVIGGAILNFMPCVLPVLALKIFNVMNNRGKNYRGHLIASIAGIFVTFIALGFIAYLIKSVGFAFGLGASFQAPQFVIILAVMMVIFTSNLLGRFEFQLPDFFVSKLSDIKFKSEYLGSFATGIIATIFATPCTAPFLGSAISFAMTAEFVQIMQIFTAIAFGFSIPYIILLIAPRLLNFLPKPGPWMESFKKILAIAMIGTVLWLLSILQAQLGLRASFGVLLLLFLIKFVFEQKRISGILRAFSIALLFGAVMYLPMIASDEDQADLNDKVASWEAFDVQKLEQYIKDGRVVLVDITADWCMTCKYNKFMLWNRSRTIKLFKDNNIITMRGDLTRPSQEIHQYLHYNGVYGIPFNVVYGPARKGGVALPTIPKYDDLVRALKMVGMD